MNKQVKECLTTIVIFISSTSWYAYLHIDEIRDFAIEHLKPIIIEEIVYPKLRQELPRYIIEDKEIYLLIDGNLTKDFFKNKIKDRVKEELKHKLKDLKADTIQETKDLIHEKIKGFTKFKANDL